MNEEQKFDREITSVKISSIGIVTVAYEDDGATKTYQDRGVISTAFSVALRAIAPIISRMTGIEQDKIGVTGVQVGQGTDGTWYRFSGYFPSPIGHGIRFPMTTPKMAPYPTSYQLMSEKKQIEYAQNHKNELSDDDVNNVIEVFGCALDFVDGERNDDLDQRYLDFSGEGEDDKDNDSSMDPYDDNEFSEGPEEKA
jgi:hypothetical protein